MLLAFISNETTQIILWIVAIGSFLGLISILLHTVITSRRKKNGTLPTDNATDDGAANAEENNLEVAATDEIVLSRNVVYSAGLNGQVKAGKYVLLSADQSTDKFNVRLNGLVHEYASGDVVTLADGDTISPVSGSVILSKAE